MMRLPTVRRCLRLTLVAGAVLSASVVFAQQIWVGGGRGSNMAPRWPKAEDFDGGFMYCRVFFEAGRRGRGGWRTDYPGADNNFSVRLAELTRVNVKFDPDRQPHHLVVALDDPLLYRCPILFLVNHGSAEFSPSEVLRLREYLLKGGFLWVDDSWGSYAWASWVDQIGQVLPPGEFPIVDIPMTHSIMHSLYDV